MGLSYDDWGEFDNAVLRDPEANRSCDVHTFFKGSQLEPDLEKRIFGKMSRWNKGDVWHTYRRMAEEAFTQITRVRPITWTSFIEHSEESFAAALQEFSLDARVEARSPEALQAYDHALARVTAHVRGDTSYDQFASEKCIGRYGMTLRF